MLSVVLISCSKDSRNQLTSEECSICDRISLFEKSKGFINDKIWKGLNEDDYISALLYFTEKETYVAFSKDTIFNSYGYELRVCQDGMKLKKLSSRLDEQPFHMENKMSFGDSTSPFYFTPMMLCSDVETMNKFVPVFDQTEDWLQMVMHEYFHSFQFSHENAIQYMAETVRANSDTLNQLYEAYPWFKESLEEENHLLLRALSTNDADSLDLNIQKFIQARQKRRDNYFRIHATDLSSLENFWETIEGTARYTEYYMAGHFNEISSDGIVCDSLFNNFQEYQNFEDYENRPEFIARTEMMVAYYYVTGFNLCRLMDKLGIEYKKNIFHSPSTGLYPIFLEHING